MHMDETGEHCCAVWKNRLTERQIPMLSLTLNMENNQSYGISIGMVITKG